MSTLSDIGHGLRRARTAVKRMTARVLKDMGLVLASLCLPRHMKRLTCMVAVHQHLVDVKILQPVSLHELNEKLHLATHEDALKFPERYYRRIWHSEEIREQAELAGVLSSNISEDNMDERVRLFCQKLAVTAPPLLRYSSTEELFNDMVDMVRQIGGYTLRRA